jgi:hypothetical protein
MNAYIAYREQLKEGDELIVVSTGLPNSRNDELKKSMKLFASCVFPSALIVDYDPTKPVIPASLKGVDYFYFSNPINSLSQDIMKLSASAHFRIFDNGLSNFIEPRPNEADFLQSEEFLTLKPRIKDIRIQLADMVLLPDYWRELSVETQVIERKQYLAGLTQLKHLADSWMPSAGLFPESYSLVIGSSLYRQNMISFDEEQALYQNTVDRLNAAGENPVFIPHMRNGVSVSNCVNLGSQILPLELWASTFKPKKAFGICSTSFLTLKFYFNLEYKLIDVSLEGIRAAQLLRVLAQRQAI